MHQRKNFDRLIGARIRLARMAYGVTQEELAFACGVTLCTVREWEAGHRELSATAMVAVTKALAIPLSFLFDDRDDAT